MTTQEFFSELDDGEEYVSILITRENYSDIPIDLMGRLVISSVRQKNKSFKDDEEHKKLVKKLSKAKKDLQNYEFNKNMER